MIILPLHFTNSLIFNKYILFFNKYVVYIDYMTNISKYLKNRFPTLFLRIVIIVLALAVSAFCIFLLPGFGTEAVVEYPGTNMETWLVLFKICSYLTLIPFFIALRSTFELLKNIDSNQALTMSSIQALKNIKYAAVSFSILYIGLIPLIYTVGEIDDAPGLILIGLAIPFVPLIIAIFAMILQRLLQSAIDLKVENDLTV